MKSFTPSRNLDDVDEDEIGNFSSDVVSMKASSGSSRKMPMTPEEEAKRASDLKLRIARVQEEQNKFRQSQKKNLRASFAAASPTSFREQSNAAKEKEKVKKLKMNKNGTAQSFNTFSILAGLKKTEFRTTMEVGASFLKNTRRLSEDLFNENSIPITHGQNHLVDHLHHHHHHHAHCSDTAEHHRPVTFHGEGYMSDEDWRITNRLKSKRQMKSLGEFRSSSAVPLLLLCVRRGEIHFPRPLFLIVVYHLVLYHGTPKSPAFLRVLIFFFLAFAPFPPYRCQISGLLPAELGRSNRGVPPGAIREKHPDG
jgi:hypothetical protein